MRTLGRHQTFHFEFNIRMRTIGHYMAGRSHRFSKLKCICFCNLSVYLFIIFLAPLYTLYFFYISETHFFLFRFLLKKKKRKTYFPIIFHITLDIFFFFLIFIF